MTDKTTTVRGHWRKNPKSGKPTWVREHTRKVNAPTNTNKITLTRSTTAVNAEAQKDYFLALLSPRIRRDKSDKEYLRGSLYFWQSVAGRDAAKLAADNPNQFLERIANNNPPNDVSEDYKKGYRHEQNRYVSGIKMESNIQSPDTLRNAIIKQNLRLYFNTENESLQRYMDKAGKNSTSYEYWRGWKSAMRTMRMHILGSHNKLWESPTSIWLEAKDMMAENKTENQYNLGWNTGLRVIQKIASGGTGMAWE